MQRSGFTTFGVRYYSLICENESYFRSAGTDLRKHLDFTAILWYNKKKGARGDIMSDNEATVKRKAKDSVFTDLFGDVENVLELYKALHPEDADVGTKDINIQTIKSVLVNTLYNDLGFLVKGKLVMLVEAQSVWNPNIPLRMLFYLSETYRRYLNDSVQSEHSETRVTLPKPELYVVYSGDKEVPDVNEKYMLAFSALLVCRGNAFYAFCEGFHIERTLNSAGNEALGDSLTDLIYFLCISGDA